MEIPAAASTPPVNRAAPSGRPARLGRSAAEVIASPEFKTLVKRRWRVSMVMLVLLFVSYYGYVLVVAGNKEFVSQKIDGVTTLAIPMGVAVIVFAWLLTAIYVAWANRSYDPEVERLRNEIRH
jgi:uncharacterized membrane protein (DUF485 family)